MPHISKIPIAELLTDMCAAAFEMGVCQVGVEIAPDDKNQKQIQERYDGNKKRVETIQKEILRRIK